VVAELTDFRAYTGTTSASTTRIWIGRTLSATLAFLSTVKDDGATPDLFTPDLRRVIGNG
jgi:hypothetical protein